MSATNHVAINRIDDAALHEGRDLAVVTDYRTVLAQKCERHLQLSDADLSDVLLAISETDEVVNPDGSSAMAHRGNLGASRPGTLAGRRSKCQRIGDKKFLD